MLTRKERMEDFIAGMQNAAEEFMIRAMNASPEIVSKEDRAYVLRNIKSDMALYFDNTLEKAAEADRENGDIEDTDYSHHSTRRVIGGLSW